MALALNNLQRVDMPLKKETNKSNTMKLNKERYNEAPKCNCKDKTGCRSECIVYKVEVYTSEPHNCKNKKVYFGSTQGALKHRYYNHKTSFTHERYKHSTSLSNYMWEIKNRQGIDPILKWEVVKKMSQIQGRW